MKKFTKIFYRISFCVNIDAQVYNNLRNFHEDIHLQKKVCYSSNFFYKKKKCFTLGFSLFFDYITKHKNEVLFLKFEQEFKISCQSNRLTTSYTG